MKTGLLLFIAILAAPQAFAQQDTATNEQAQPKSWNHSVSLALGFNQSKLDNPPIGYGIDQVVANSSFAASADYDHQKTFWSNQLSWNFGVVRFGAGPIEPGSSQKIPFQKALDQLQVSTFAGYRLTQDSALSLLAGFDFFSQVTPSYGDAEGKLPGVFLTDIRKSSSNPILASFFSPASTLAYVGIGWRPIPKLFIGYSPTTYKGIIVLNETAAQLVGLTDGQGLPIATVHGNPVEIVNGQPVFKNAFHQFGSFMLATYRDSYLKDRIGFSSSLRLFSNYLKNPERIDIFWQNKLNLNIVKGLSVAYMFNLFYDYDVLVQITDKDVPGGFSGEFGRKVATQRQLMLQYALKF